MKIVQKFNFANSWKFAKLKIHENFVLYGIPELCSHCRATCSGNFARILHSSISSNMLYTNHDPVIWPSVSNLVSFLSSKDTSCKIFPPNFVVLVPTPFAITHRWTAWMLIVQCPSAWPLPSSPSSLPLELLALSRCPWWLPRGALCSHSIACTAFSGPFSGMSLLHGVR